jgi:hypothetical protein
MLVVAQDYGTAKTRPGEPLQSRAEKAPPFAVELNKLFRL